ncbi:iron uptake transporter deferrochelatase/peroxidase subunit [Corynebacterium alimapuense]|uniref:Deferrochelatase n=1 Tax=Corynebacterium alimapuense TaxID=1576874 RepID=A0A3M8K6H9_9CORY|nr:iron uptake transporter deferrochelatase/peroxidase subunit [Corynebacterium alimapuense]RNE48345.1 deferrochelatase/peroxidase EfeB [Corynebacterium alimapuense]
MATMNRRQVLGLLGAGGIGALAGGGTVAIGTQAAAQSEVPPETDELAYPFEGAHQAGIITPAQDRIHFAAFTVDPEATRDDLIDLLERWTHACRRLVLGAELSARGAFGGGENFPPEDSGEASDLGPSGLTVTFGFGRTLFDDRFGLAEHMPADFTDIPVMSNDFIDPDRSDGDLCIQACANDPQVASHAIRNLTRMAIGTAVLKWSQIGFGRTSSTSESQKTPRNLFGQKDGTSNLKAEESELLDEHVWISDEQAQDWAIGGTYLTARRITMTIEVWDTLQLEEQERVLGREKFHGAPLTGTDEFDEPDFSATTERGLPVIDERAHVRRVHPDNNDGIQMLRRGYNFIDGNDAQGRLNAGLFFIAFTKTPARFAQVHSSMARDDMFVEYLKTTNSGVYLVPPGVGTEDYVGQTLFEA